MSQLLTAHSSPMKPLIPDSRTSVKFHSIKLRFVVHMKTNGSSPGHTDTSPEGDKITSSVGFKCVHNNYYGSALPSNLLWLHVYYCSIDVIPSMYRLLPESVLVRRIIRCSNIIICMKQMDSIFQPCYIMYEIMIYHKTLLPLKYIFRCKALVSRDIASSCRRGSHDLHVS